MGNNTLILCLIEKESGWNNQAIGKENEIGILQFKKQTFYTFSRRYDLDLDIYDPADQIFLAEKMINDGFIYHWTTSKQCWKNYQNY